MFNKNSTPFKLKGSPFKNDPTVKNKLIGGAGGHNTDFTPNADGSKPTEYTNTRRNVYDGNNLVQSNTGNGGGEVSSVSSTGPAAEPTEINLKTSGNSINEAGGITRTMQSQTGTINNSNQQSSGDILKAPAADGSTQYKGKDYIGDVLMKSKRFKGLSGKALVDAGHISKDKADEWNNRTSYSAPENNNNSNSSNNLKTTKASGTLGVYDYGTKQSSYESRQNMRTTKHSTNTTKNREIANARLKWKGMSEEQREAAGGSRRDFMKAQKVTSKTKRNDAIIAKGESESLNSQNASDQNIAEGGKVRGAKRDLTNYDDAETIKGAQASLDLAVSNADDTTSLEIEANELKAKTPPPAGFRSGPKYGKRATPFKQKGYTFSASKK
tara:strand:+ start:151 stop:1302 length:1152 start_codon:yes stop_codon:yes gene_type:complete